MEDFKPDFGVFLFVVAGFVKDGGDLLVAIFFGLASIILIFDRGLRFASEGSGEVLPSFARFIDFFHKLLLI